MNARNRWQYVAWFVAVVLLILLLFVTQNAGRIPQ